MDVNIVSTGSVGNFNVIDGVIAIDCGVKRQMYIDHGSEVEHILISHEHGDHLNTSVFKWIMKTNPSMARHGLHVNSSTLAKIAKHAPGVADHMESPLIKAPDIREIPTSKGTYTVETYALAHDVENQGFIITDPRGKTLIHATDTMTMEHAPSRKYDYLLIEGNWDEDTLVERLMSDDPGEAFRASRNLRHQSVQACHQFIKNHSHEGSVAWQLHESSEFGVMIDLGEFGQIRA